MQTRQAMPRHRGASLGAAGDEDMLTMLPVNVARHVRRESVHERDARRERWPGVRRGLRGGGEREQCEKQACE